MFVKTQSLTDDTYMNKPYLQLMNEIYALIRFYYSSPDIFFYIKKTRITPSKRYVKKRWGYWIVNMPDIR